MKNGQRTLSQAVHGMLSILGGSGRKHIQRLRLVREPVSGPYLAKGGRIIVTETGRVAKDNTGRPLDKGGYGTWEGARQRADQLNRLYTPPPRPKAPEGTIYKPRHMGQTALRKRLRGAETKFNAQSKEES